MRRPRSRRKPILPEQHLEYVRALAAQIKEKLPPDVEYDELVAYGTQGLLEAARRFDPRGGARFSTFAYYRIRGAIFDGLRNMGRLPRSEYARRRRRRSLESPSPTTDRDGAGAAFTSDALAGITTVFMASLITLDPRGGSDAATPDERIGRVQRLKLLRAALAGLPDTPRRLLELHYFHDKSLKEAARELGLSKSWASRLHTRAVLLLREELERTDPPRRAAPTRKGR